MKSFEFLGWLFASQKTGYPGFRYRSSRFPRFAQSSGRLWRPYYPCHGLILEIELKTHGSCKQNIHWCEILQHEPGTDLDFNFVFPKKINKNRCFSIYLNSLLI